MDGNNEGWRPFSRRELLKRVGGASAAAAVPAHFFRPVLDRTSASVAAFPPSAAQTREALQTLTATEAEVLEAITARLIPSDDSGPGAAEARAARYIDRALGGALASSRDAYRTGLAALDRHAQATKGAPFVRLSTTDQDAVLHDLENNVGTGFTPSPAAFFNLVLNHTIQGTFCDPHYGGNANFVGWDLIGYPGVRLAVTSEEQRMDAHPAATHKSAYDYPMFAGHSGDRASLERDGGVHGD